MCKRMGLIDWIILGGTVSSKRVQRGTAQPDGHPFDLTKHKQGAWWCLGERWGCFRLSWSLNASHRPPSYRIPSHCKQSDILKSILVSCQGLSFTTYYSHVKVHQDESVSFANLSQKAQLNCIFYHTVKQQKALDGLDRPALSCMFLLEPICIFVRGEKMTSDTSKQLRFWAHCQLAHSYYSSKGIISHKQFDEIDWSSVQGTTHELLWLFQIWATK